MTASQVSSNVSLKLLEIHKVISFKFCQSITKVFPMGRDKDRSRVKSKRNFRNVIFAIVQYRSVPSVKFLYEMVYLYGQIRESARNLKAETFD